MATRKFTQRSRIREGRPNSLGATWDGLGVNFALYSRNATRVELCLFDDRGREQERIALPEYTDEVWHGYLPTHVPASCMAIACMGRMRPTPVTASTTINCCWTRTLNRSLANSNGRRIYSVTSSAIATRT